MKESNWIQFEVYPGLKAKALVVDGKIEAVKLITHVPICYYYSFLNDAGLEAEKIFNKNHLIK